MSGVLQGFATIGVIIGLGAFLAQVRILDLDAMVVLSRLSFFVASPALLVTVLADTDTHGVLSRNLAATTAGVVVTAGTYVLLARRVLHKPAAETVVGTLCAAYVNAGNLGLPVAAYALGGVSLVAPTLLLQLVVLQPLALTVLDHAVAPGRLSVLQVLSRPFRTPLTVGCLIGLALSVTGTEIPRVVDDPLSLVGGIAVPSMLIAYGISLRLGPKPGADSSPGELALLAVLKLVVQPLATYAAGRFALGLDGAELLAVTVLAALPTAQNIFVHATRYARGMVLARDTIFVTTVLSVPTVLVIVALLA